MRGFKHSDEAKKNMSTAQKGKKSTYKGKSHSKESKQKMSDTLREIDKQHYKCPHCLNEGRSRAFKGWHFDKCKKNPNNVPNDTKNGYQDQVSDYMN